MTTNNKVRPVFAVGDTVLIHHVGSFHTCWTKAVVFEATKKMLIVGNRTYTYHPSSNSYEPKDTWNHDKLYTWDEGKEWYYRDEVRKRNATLQQTIVQHIKDHASAETLYELANTLCLTIPAAYEGEPDLNPTLDSMYPEAAPILNSVQPVVEETPNGFVNDYDPNYVPTEAEMTEEWGDISPTGHSASEFYAEAAECRSALRHDKWGNSIQ